MKIKPVSLFLAALFSVCVALLPAADTHPTQVKHVEAPQAAELLSKDTEVIVLDIRTPKEFKAGHIKGAKNIDFYEDDFAEQIGKLDRSKTYLVHCASGGRSGKSLELFEKLDFVTIYHLDGGFKGWEKAGKPVEK